MKLQFKSKQRGVPLLGLAFVGGVLVCVGILGAQAFPTFTEYQAVLKAVEKAKAGSSVVEARTIFDKAAQVDDIKSISGKDLEVTQNGGKTTISFAYTKEIHMAGPAYLLLKYSGQSK